MTTDHSGTIHTMREQSATLTGPAHRTRVLTLALAADLLEMHDATGISLDQWDNGRDFVQAVADVYAIPYTFTPNHA